MKRSGYRTTLLLVWWLLLLTVDGHPATMGPSTMVGPLGTDKALALGVAVTLCGKNTDAPITPLLSAAYVF